MPEPDTLRDTTGAPARVAVVTVSDSRARGGADPGGDAAAELLESLGATVAHRARVPDHLTAIREALLAALERVELVVLTGGTGMAARDVTPQAVAPFLDFEVPGLAEAMRATGFRHTPHALLSRQVAGVARGRLVLALPGSPAAVRECLSAVAPALPHALALLRGETAHPPATSAG